MTKREKVLAGIVGGIVAVFLNWFLIGFFAKNHSTLQQDFSRKETQLKMLQTLIKDRGMWEQRAAWVEANQPKLTEPERAGVRLMEEVREIAKRHDVQIAPETFSFLPTVRKEDYTSVPVTLETKSSWKALINFLAELQGPQKFIVIENANLKKNSADQTQMLGKMTIAKWYAPTR